MPFRQENCTSLLPKTVYSYLPKTVYCYLPITIIELDKEELTQVEGEGDVSRDTYRHIRMLKLAFSDCMEIQPQVENADLSHKSLIKLTKNYHNYVCEDQECIVYEKKLGPLKIYLAPVIGVTTSSLQFNTEFFSKLNYEQDLNLTIGIQLNATLTRINERISLQFDLLYGNNDFHGTYDQSYGNFYFDPYGIYNGDYELYINNDLLQSSLLLKYSFTQLKVRPSLGVGILYNFLLNQEARAFGERANGDPPQEKVLEDIYMASNLIGGVAQIGLNYRIFKNRELFTHFRYTLSGGKANGREGFVKTTINSFNLSVGFYLSKVE